MVGRRGRPPYANILTPGEWRVVEAVRHGLTNPEIAHRQGVSVDAVKYHVANILQKLGFSSRAELRQWDGVAAVSAARNWRKVDVEDSERLGPIGQISRTVSDLAEARRWYADVLGLEELYSFGDIAFFDCGGVRLFLSEGDGASESIVYFKVRDVHGTYKRLAANGVHFTNAPHMIHRHENGVEEWMAFFQDNEDRPLAIMAKTEPSAVD